MTALYLLLTASVEPCDALGDLTARKGYLGESLSKQGGDAVPAPSTSA